MQPAKITTISQCKSFVDVLQFYAVKHPSDVAITFLVGDLIEQSCITYSELDRRAVVIATSLLKQAEPGDRILLLFPQGIEFITAFFGCLYAGMIAIPVPLPQKKHSLSRVQTVATNCQAQLILTQSSSQSKLLGLLHGQKHLAELPCLSVNEFIEEPIDDWVPHVTDVNSPAYLQYTSGSTSMPKGVIISHHNMIHNIGQALVAWELPKAYKSVCWTPLTHDLGLINGLLMALFNAGSCYLMDPATFLQKPLRWLEAVSRYQVHHTNGPNFAFELCLQRITEEQSDQIDLSHLKVFVNGGEPVQLSTMERFQEKFRYCGLRLGVLSACYGMAEATLTVSTGMLSQSYQAYNESFPQVEDFCHTLSPGKESEKQIFYSNGVLLPGMELKIVDPKTLEEVPGRNLGEIWLSSPSIARGYWEDEQATEETFQAYLKGRVEGPFLRTGDLGFLHQSELFIAGRIKDIIILQGQNHYPQDIEYTADSAHSALRRSCSAAFLLHEDAGEQVGMILEVGRKALNQIRKEIKKSGVSLLSQDIFQQIRRKVMDHHGLEPAAMVLIKPGTVLKTTSGKIQRSRNGQAFLNGEFEPVDTYSKVKQSASIRNQSVDQKKLPEKTAVQQWLINWVSLQTGLEDAEINEQTQFAHFGLGSVKLVLMAGDLEENFGISLSPTISYEHPNINQLSTYLSQQSGVKTKSSMQLGHKQKDAEPIAIVGLSCRFPGAVNSQEFWQILKAGKDCITKVPVDRWLAERYLDQDPSVPGKMTMDWGGFIDKADTFDAEFFGINDREAEQMDPQQRILLELTWEALEDAGILPEQLACSQTGVFIGIGSQDYSAWQSHQPELLDGYSGTGSRLCIAANRISYNFDFRGPSIAIDSACSSSLVAVHTACKSIQNGESSAAVAGGASLIWSPFSTITMSKAGALSPDGRCKAFDARANGYVRAEGAGLVILKSLSQAEQDGDFIYGLILGSATQQDGRSNGLTAPRQQSQEMVIKKAAADAGINLSDLQYVETHGTGTLLGDPIEAAALGAVLKPGRVIGEKCHLGSVKTNIGHLEEAAGIAGLIKLALSFKYQLIPKNLHFTTPNPYIDFDLLGLSVQEKLEPWPQTEQPPLAGISSFGIGGSLAHLILQAPEKKQERLIVSQTDSAYLLPLSARNQGALLNLVKSYHSFFQERDVTPDLLYQAGRTTSLQRSHHDERVCFCVQNRQDLLSQLEEYLAGEERGNLSTGHRTPGKKRKIVFVFPGHGPQWIGMGQELYQKEPVFREALEQCDRGIQQYTGWSLKEKLFAQADEATFENISIMQPAIFAIQVALSKLWNHWGIRADAVVGHSMGEIAAAHIADIISLDDAIRVICKRSELLHRIHGEGAMAIVELPEAESKQWLSGYEKLVSIAAVNSPRSTVLSGQITAIDEIIGKLEQHGVFARKINVDVASHSPQVEPLCQELQDFLSELKTKVGTVPFFSTVRGKEIKGTQLQQKYWMENLRHPVLFSTAITQLLDEQYDTFLEISPHRLQLANIAEHQPLTSQPLALIPSILRDRGEFSSMREALGSFYCLGATVRWEQIYSVQGSPLPLPTYPWQGKSYRLKSLDWERTNKVIEEASSPLGGLPGTYLRPHKGDCGLRWELELSVERFPFLEDHQVQGNVVIPATFYLAMIRAMIQQVYGKQNFELHDFEIQAGLFLSAEAGVRIVQLVLEPGQGEQASIRIISLDLESPPYQPTWQVHVSGTLVLENIKEATKLDLADDFLTKFQQTSQVLLGADHYQKMSHVSIDYGPSFQGIQEIYLREGEALAKLKKPAIPRGQVEQALDTVLLDSCLQPGMYLFTSSSENLRSYLPTRIGRICFYRSLEMEEEYYTKLKVADYESGSDRVCFDSFAFDKHGRMIFEIKKMEATLLEETKLSQSETKVVAPFFHQQWISQELPRLKNETTSGENEEGRWLIFGNFEEESSCLKFLRETEIDCWFLRIPTNSDQEIELNRILQEEVQEKQNYQKIFVFAGAPEKNSDKIRAEEIQKREQSLCQFIVGLVGRMAKVGWRTPPTLYLITQGSQFTTSSIDTPLSVGSSLWGLGMVLMQEHPEFPTKLVDLSPTPSLTELEKLIQEVKLESLESRVLLRQQERYVARLQAGLPTVDKEKSHFTAHADRHSFALALPEFGQLDHLYWQESPRCEPEYGEVEIKVSACGLNFMDVMTVLGINPSFTNPESIVLGGEVAGEILRIGPGVENLQVGDQVLAVTSQGYRTHALVDHHYVARKPSQISLIEAATLPLAFMTAYYALVVQGRIQKGEKVLIHAASGGVGLAAVQIARFYEAEIFVTAGKEFKREYLRSLGLTHVMDSRTLDFADEVQQQTQGLGVDIVLNCLAGKAIQKSLDVLAHGGRFLEIGKRDIYENLQMGLFPFQNNLSYFAIDLIKILEKQPDYFATLLQEVLQAMEQNHFKPLPVKVFPASQVVDAFHHMAQAEHIGKIGVLLDRQEVRVAPINPGKPLFDDQASYLITGGLGGIGLALTRWMSEQGAGTLVLMGRSSPSLEVRGELEQLKQDGAKIEIFQGDVGRIEDLQQVIHQIDAKLPPLKGIFHAAGLLDDAMLINLEPAQFEKVLNPKIKGSWHLHQLTEKHSLDYFVTFSTVASLLGSPGQGNYAAGNAFLDSLMGYRLAKGLPAINVNWGPWREVGLAAADTKRADRLAYRGLDSILPDQGLAALRELLEQKIPQSLVLTFDLIQWQQYYPKAAHWPFFQFLEQQDKGVEQNSNFRERLLLEDIKDQSPMLQAHLAEQIGKVLRKPPAEIENGQHLGSLGLDSLMSLELRNRLENSLSIRLTAGVIWSHPTLAKLTVHLSKKIGIFSEQEVPATVGDSKIEPEGEDSLLELLEMVDDISLDDLDQLALDEP
ncbi:MAG: hypothetical protein COB67_10830 [SAR324 cluster bacterium]|uniref:Beta-ketoacyl synthase n=1 Tax=SAR324 cluster bacterium TaxID=2024889 RepID=A0A2A4SX27_9DELT|nr:MAG: hypothetical protein COB67_10830 [SAR324 cluster bacterium]